MLVLDPGEQIVLRVRANSNSSVGHSRCCNSIGMAKNAPFGSIWVACARSASSRWVKYLPHSIWVVTRTMRSARASLYWRIRSSHSCNGNGSPMRSYSAENTSSRFMLKPWS